MTGPATADNCHVAEVVVMRRGRPSGVTTRGGIDRDAGFAKPRAVPNAPTNAKIGPDSGRVRPDVDHHQHRRGCFAQKREHGDPATVETVGQCSGKQDEEGGGQKLGQADEPEIELASCDVEYQLSGSNSYGHAATRGEEPAEEQQLHRRIRDQLAQ